MKARLMERFRNVLAWFGISLLILSIYVVITTTTKVLFGLAGQGLIGVINYLIMGSFRLLPWRAIPSNVTSD